MGIAESKAISVGICCSYADAYEFLRVPENFPKWASGLGESLRRDGDAWIAETPDGPMLVRFTPKNEFGVLDHFVSPAPGTELHIPLRVIPNGEGCEVTLILFRQSGMSDEKFEQDAAWGAPGSTEPQSAARNITGARCPANPWRPDRRTRRWCSSI